MGMLIWNTPVRLMACTWLVYIYILYRWETTYYVSGMHIQIGYDYRIRTGMVSFPLHGTSSFFTEPTTGMKLAKVISNILGTRSLQQTSGITVERILPMGPKQLTPIYSLSLIATYKPTGNPSLPLDVHGHFSFKLLLPSPNKIIHG